MSGCDAFFGLHARLDCMALCCPVVAGATRSQAADMPVRGVRPNCHVKHGSSA